MTGSVVVLERTIDASMADVWSVLADADHRVEMFRGVDAVEMMDAVPPQHAVMVGMMGHDLVTLSFALTPQRMDEDCTRLAMTMHADIKSRSKMGQAAWHAWGGLALGHDRRLLMRNMDSIAHAAEALHAA